MEKKTEKKTSNLESNKTLKQTISVSVSISISISVSVSTSVDAEKSSAKEEAEKVESIGVPLAGSCSSGEGSVRLAPHSVKDEKKPAEEQAPPKKHHKRDQEKFLLPVASRGKNDLSNPAKLRAWVSSRRPIIVVPQAVTSLITLHNAKEVLQHLHFVQPDMESLLDAPTPEEVVIERDFPIGRAREYRIIDNVSKLGIDEWQRVVAVFALGPHRQFRGWPWMGDPAVIFRKVCVFHLYYQDVGVHKDLLNMAVHPLEIPKNEPHTHGGILKEFWGTLDEYVRTQSQFSFLAEEGSYLPE
ncbi:parafibromin isoform X2 [Drosophila miranda]|uniref:parafibromin isoform X2 n=1 Tax=Drosophila miranda TaxID=7229 RepID=UPI0007E75F86|nr:parafibromin isoform X2 [Drosophila miranda]